MSRHWTALYWLEAWLSWCFHECIHVPGELELLTHSNFSDPSKIVWNVHLLPSILHEQLTLVDRNCWTSNTFSISKTFDIWILLKKYLLSFKPKWFSLHGTMDNKFTMVKVATYIDDGSVIHCEIVSSSLIMKYLFSATTLLCGSIRVLSNMQYSLSCHCQLHYWFNNFFRLTAKEKHQNSTWFPFVRKSMGDLQKFLGHHRQTQIYCLSFFKQFSILN